MKKATKKLTDRKIKIDLNFINMKKKIDFDLFFDKLLVSKRELVRTTPNVYNLTHYLTLI